MCFFRSKRKTVRFPEAQTRKQRTTHRPKRKRANQLRTPRAIQAGNSNNRAQANQEGANPCYTPTSRRARLNRKENPHGAGTRGKPRKERGHDMHCTHEGRKAENRQTAEKGPKARKEGSRTPTALAMYNSKEPEKGAQGRKRSWETATHAHYVPTV